MARKPMRGEPTHSKHSGQVYHRTANLAEASYLMTKKYQFEGTMGDNRKDFVFSGQGIHKAVLDFHNGDSVPAKVYAENFRGLKDYIYARNVVKNEVRDQKAPRPKMLREEMENDNKGNR